jgi:hypothetical protein
MGVKEAFLTFAFKSLGFTTASTKPLFDSSYTTASKSSLMSDDWRPSEVTLKLLEESCGDMQLIEHQATLFKVYWINRNEPRPNWDALFIGRLSYLQPVSTQTDDLRSQSIEEMLNDRSWAD